MLVYIQRVGLLCEVVCPDYSPGLRFLFFFVSSKLISTAPMPLDTSSLFIWISSRTSSRFQTTFLRISLAGFLLLLLEITFAKFVDVDALPSSSQFTKFDKICHAGMPVLSIIVMSRGRLWDTRDLLYLLSLVFLNFILIR